jgi:DNA-binding transcriptional MerR regulator
MLSIGEFAHSTMLSIKTIRYYQELGILLPDRIDKGTGYRYYDQKSYDRARSIQMLKDLGFTLNEIRQILSECRDEEDLFLYIDQKLNDVEKKIQNLKRMKDQLIRQKKASSSGDPWEGGIIEFDFELPCYVSHKFNGTYEQIGDAFSSLYKQYGRFVK